DDFVRRTVGLLPVVGDAEVVDDDLGAVAGELQGVRAADAAARAGDDGDAAFEKTGQRDSLVDVQEDGRFAAAVAPDAGTADVRSKAAGQEDGDVADLVGSGHPAQRDRGFDLGDPVVAAVVVVGLL